MITFLTVVRCPKMVRRKVLSSGAINSSKPPCAEHQDLEKSFSCFPLAHLKTVLCVKWCSTNPHFQSQKDISVGTHLICMFFSLSFFFLSLLWHICLQLTTYKQKIMEWNLIKKVPRVKNTLFPNRKKKIKKCTNVLFHCMYWDLILWLEQILENLDGRKWLLMPLFYVYAVISYRRKDLLD